MDESLKEAWNRFVEHNYTLEDLLLILDSIKEDDYLQEFYEVDDKVWNEVAYKTPSLTKAQEKEYSRKAAQLLKAYERKHGVQPIHTCSRRMGRFRKVFYAAAVAVVLCLLIPVSYLYLKSKIEPSNIQYVEKIARHGEIISFELPDATKVTLNAGSRMLFPDNFGTDERTVKLYGEALFEVTSDPTRPFIVKNENMNVRVLGTVFNVKAYADDIWETVSVISGKVEVDLMGEKALLEQNQQVKMNKADGRFEKLIVDADKYVSWTRRTLYFDLMPIQEVVNTLNRYYPETEIKLAEGEYTNMISGEHENESLNAVLTSIIYSTGLHCKKQGKKYTIYSNNNHQ